VASRFAVVWLLAAGAVLGITGLAGIVAGTYLSAWLYSLLPPLIIDAAAVGGAATASGAALVGLGIVHLAAGALVRRGMGGAITAAVVLAATMGVLCIGWGAAALVSAVAGSGPPVGLLPAGIGLGLVAAGYGWTAHALIGLRAPPNR